MSHRQLLAILALAALITGGLLYAGPLNPPAGPVGSTYKTLNEIEPRIAINATNTPGDPIGDPSPSLFKITQPGSYYLTGNIVGVVGKHGIEIAASGVTLDLNGFELLGVAGMGPFDGVNINVSGFAGITLRNGHIDGWGGEGVDFGTAAISCCRVNGIIARRNVGRGINVGDSTVISDCTTEQNTAGGVRFVGGGVISSCSSSENGGDGFVFGGVTNVSHCLAFQNTGNGYSASDICSFTSCTAYMNTLNGFSVGSGTTVDRCTARLNTLDGIQCVVGCFISGNSCMNNGNGAGSGAGIHAIGSDNRIEANNCTGADRGIDVDVAGNIIIKNICSGNTTNWDIVASNAVAPIVSASTNAAPIVGSTYTGSLGSTDANANFTY